MAKIAGRSGSVYELLSFMEQFPDDSAERFREMLVLDAITFNADRHYGNFGVLIDNDTLKPLTMAPVFDLNKALLPHFTDDELQHAEDKLSGYEPALGNDFTILGQGAMTDSIREKLSGLRGFQFSFRGDDFFPESRVKALENIVNWQIEAVLSM